MRLTLTGVLTSSEEWEVSVGPAGVLLKRVYPCRCGDTHRGEWAAETWNHHNCYHREPLVRFEDVQDWYICGECGEVFTSENAGPSFPHEE